MRTLRFLTEATYRVSGTGLTESALLDLCFWRNRSRASPRIEAARLEIAMLMSGAQLIVRWQDGQGFRCESFERLAVQNPALIIIADSGTASAQTHARDLYNDLVAELLAIGAIQQHSAPCGIGSHGPVTGCHAERDPDCQKLLVMVGDGGQAFANQRGFAPWAAGDPAHTVLPLVPISAKAHFSSLFPNWVGIYNAVFWGSSPVEGVHAVLALAGITAEQPKIFISYRQTESANLAIQIFDALGHAGFDVFLDHFRIPPGVNFQARLTEQLGDKSMVLFLESNTFLQSQWVTYEVNVAKTCGLGLQALNLCGAPEIQGIDEALRTRLTAADFEGGICGPTAVLTSNKLQGIVSLIRQEHDRAIVRRRKYLEAALEGAVLLAGGMVPTSTGSGAKHVVSSDGTKRYTIALTPRPPDLPDFYRVHGQTAHQTTGVVVGLSRLMEPSRHDRLTWLATVSTLKFRDEGEILALAEQMVRGTL